VGSRDRERRDSRPERERRRARRARRARRRGADTVARAEGGGVFARQGDRRRRRAKGRRDRPRRRAAVTETYFLASAPKNPQAIAILFPGSGGWIKIRTERGQPRFGQDNFLVRVRSDFVKRGVVAAIVDAPSDQQSGDGMDDVFRLGPNHFADITAVVADLTKRFPDKPVFLIGTSRGTISAAALGARFGDQIAGVILTSTLFSKAGSSPSKQGLSKFDFATIKVPLLFVHHVSDQCQYTQYAD